MGYVNCLHFVHICRMWAWYLVGLLGGLKAPRYGIGQGFAMDLWGDVVEDGEFGRELGRMDLCGDLLGVLGWA